MADNVVIDPRFQHTAQTYLSVLDLIKPGLPKLIDKKGEWEYPPVKAFQDRLRRALLVPENVLGRQERWQLALDAQVYTLPRLALQEAALLHHAEHLKGTGPMAEVFSLNALSQVAQELAGEVQALMSNYAGVPPSPELLAKVNETLPGIFMPLFTLMGALPTVGCTMPLQGRGLQASRFIFSQVLAHRSAVALVNQRSFKDHKEVLKAVTEPQTSFAKGVLGSYCTALGEQLFAAVK